MTNRNQIFKAKKFKKLTWENINEANSIEVNFYYQDFEVYLDLNEKHKIESIEIFNQDKLLKINYEQIKTFLNL